jgi:hypothetical protein
MEMSMQDALELLQAKAEKAGQKPTKAKAKPKAKAKAKAKPKAKKAAPASSEAVAGSSD